MKTPALSIENLTIRYPGYKHTAIDSVSFTVRENSIAALIGPNGSGKTTIIKAILGLLAYEGTIKVFGEPVNKMYKKIGYVPQKFSFDQTFPITVYDFISLVLFAYPKEKTARQIDKVLNYVEASDIINQRLSDLSGGQLQRVLLARALVHDPELLLLDEPEAGVDVGGEQTFYDLLEKLVKDKKITAVIASHELDIVYAYANQVICVNRRMFCEGVPNEVLTQEMFEQLYGRGLKFYGHTHTHHHKK
ncbi:metal ABC transporter ATP-binding protein [Patescibacteria group bacterium]|nr:metal ABC transporter ATP-binding protein [Patescibacteria group bacterium]